MKVFYSILFLVTVSCCIGQSPYRLSWGQDIAWVLGGNAVLFGSGLIDVQPLTIAEINALDPMDVNSFDRSATENYSEAAGHRSDVGLIAGPVLALGSTFALPLSQNKRQKQFWQDFGTLALIWYETNTAVVGVTNLTKALSLRTRPFVYNPAAPLDEKLETDARFAFFSGHTSITTANFFLLAKFYSDYYPDSKWKPWVWTGAAAISAWTGIERYNAGKHFFTDIITGYAVGALGGYLIPHLHKRKGPLGTSMRIVPVFSSEATTLSISFQF